MIEMEKVIEGKFDYVSKNEYDMRVGICEKIPEHVLQTDLKTFGYDC